MIAFRLHRYDTEARRFDKEAKTIYVNPKYIVLVEPFFRDSNEHYDLTRLRVLDQPADYFVEGTADVVLRMVEAA